jgi:hypothetical protein
MRVGRLLVAAALAPLAGVTCHEATPPQGCDLCTTSATVVGAVRDSLGVPSRGVLTMATAFADSCAGAQVSLLPTGFPPGPTDSTGRYVLELRTALAPFRACIAVTALSALDTMYRADTVVLAKALQFRDDHPAGGAHDTLAVDVVLHHR